MTPTPDVATDEETRLRQASALLGVPFVRLVGRHVPRTTLLRIPEAVARNERIIAYEEMVLPSKHRVVRLAVADPNVLSREAPPVVHDLHRDQNLVIEVGLTPAGDLDAIIDQYAARHQEETPPVSLPTNTGSQLPTVTLTHRTIAKEILQRIPQETAAKYRLVVFDILEQGKLMAVALERPADPKVQELLSFIRDRNHLKLQLFQTSAESIDAALRQYPAPPPPALAPPTPAKTGRRLPHSPKPGIADVTPSPSDQPKVREVRPDELSTPDLHVPKSETVGLIPLSADVERDLLTVVGQDIRSIDELEVIIRTGFIPKIVGALLLLAATMGASDIHVQAAGDDVLIRYRVDGILRDIIKMPASLQAPVVSRIKILAKLKIDEQRVPQDGRFDIVIGQRAIDLRVSTFPTVHGEKVVLRLLDKSAGLVKLEQLGLTGSRLERLRKEMGKPYGVILSTGPTGSGKSTTLYAILQEIAGPEVNVVTLEDPVEYEIPLITQAQIKPKIGFGFAEGLRSILRQDPDIIMVGEIRDLETASMMTHAALTGHLVLSTLHTNDAAGALPRLINMGVEPFLITSAMNGIMAQRLVRKLCEKCRVPMTPPEAVVKEIRAVLETDAVAELLAALEKDLTFYKPKGCPECYQGFRGRIGIFEVLIMTDAIEELAVKKAPASEIVVRARHEGMVTMEQDGYLKVLAGLTTIDEVMRVTKTE